MAKPIYRRVIVKISGEVLAGHNSGQGGDPGGKSGDFGVQQATLERIAADLAATRALGYRADRNDDGWLCAHHTHRRSRPGLF